MKNCLKFLTAACFFAFTAVAASAQFGIHTGYVYTQTDISYKNSNDVSNTLTNGVYLGIDYDINLVAGLSVQPGIFYSYAANEDKTRVNLLGQQFSREQDHIEHSLLVPVHAKYSFNIVEDILKLYLFAGPTFNVGLSAFDKIEYDGGRIEGDFTYNCYTGKVTVNEGFHDVSSSSFTQDFDNAGKTLQRFDVLVGGGAGLRVVRFLDIKVGYDYGLLNRAAKSYRDNMSMHASRFYVGLGIRF
ncbi:MAG: PorT family protein [Bacteroidales bacterium]|nr:PorT family protein [Bacteroidales bacterium]